MQKVTVHCPDGHFEEGFVAVLNATAELSPRDYVNQRADHYCKNPSPAHSTTSRQSSSSPGPGLPQFPPKKTVSPTKTTPSNPDPSNTPPPTTTTPSDPDPTSTTTSLDQAISSVAVQIQGTLKDHWIETVPRCGTCQRYARLGDIPTDDAPGIEVWRYAYTKESQ
ncbi:hypothetical protein EDD86DRAFT_246357 [Gorgonomyces haynaldii]|nr:hypothetical protein EDD86DRAFT_246357 [Gorgonomyces haynaldii]